jgi:hypothetical protein
VLTWGDLGVGSTFHDVGCVAFPTESGWMPGEEVPGSRGLFVTPKVTRDRNGDAWLVWDMRGIDVTRFTHTYVSATSSTPTIAAVGRRRVVRWTLSELAPESWWAVMRARRGEEFDQVARVQAGTNLDVSWVDDSPPRGHLRYKIRRESVNTAFAWESEEGSWPRVKGPPELLTVTTAAPAPAGDRSARVELEGAAAGPIDIALYDLQGRLVLRQESFAIGTGKESITLDFASASRPLTPGIYFVVARDGAGRQSDAVKLAIVR